MQVRERRADPLLQWRLDHVRAILRSAPRLFDSKSQLEQPRDHVSLVDLFDFGASLRAGGRCGLCFRRAYRRRVCCPRNPRRFRPLACLLALLFHESRAKRAFSRVLVVGAALCRVDARLATARDLIDVVELDPLTGATALSRLAGECALATVALPDGATDMRRDCARRPARASRKKRAIGRREFALLELADQRLQRQMKHLREIARGKLVAEQLLRALQ